MMIRATALDYMRPRFGFTLDQWAPLVRLALAYQHSDGGYDFPDGRKPDPPRLLFARRLRPQLLREEWTA